MVERHAPAMSRKEWGLLLLLALAWGGSFLYAKIVIAELAPLVTVMWRVVLGAAVLLAVTRLCGYRMPRDPAVWAAFFAMGLLNNVIPFTLFTWSQTRIPSGLAAIINGATPLFTVLLAHLLTRSEPLTAQRLFGALAGLGGVAVMIGAEALNGLGGNLPAELAGIAATISYACAGIFGRRFSALPPLVSAAGQVTASAVIMSLVVPLIEPHWLPIDIGLGTGLALAALALVTTVLGYILYFRILATAGATNLLVVTLLMPFIAILLGALILGERLALRHFMGMALIIIGIVAIDGRPGRWLLARFGKRNKALAPAPLLD